MAVDWGALVGGLHNQGGGGDLRHMDCAMGRAFKRV